MDKFDRRPSAKQKRTRLLWFLIAATLPTSWLITMFAFGNKALPWFFASYAVLLVVISVVRGKEVFSNLRLWEKSLNF